MDNLTTEDILNNLANAEQELAKLRPGHDASAAASTRATAQKSYAAPEAPNYARVKHLEGAIYCMRQELEKRHGQRMPNIPSRDDIVSSARRGTMRHDIPADR